MKQKNVKKLIILVIMLIAIINIGLIVNLFFNDIAGEIYTSPSIIVVVMQVIAIIISVITLKKHINTNKEKFLIIILIVILLITFFIPVQTDMEYPQSMGGLTPTVLPKELKQNLYNITIWS